MRIFPEVLKHMCGSPMVKTAQGHKLLQDKINEWNVYQKAVDQIIGGVLYDG